MTANSQWCCTVTKYYKTAWQSNTLQGPNETLRCT